MIRPGDPSSPDEATIKELEAEIERLRAALEYYASGIAGRSDIARHVLKDKP